MQLIEQQYEEYQALLGMAELQANAIDHPQITAEEKERLRHGLESLRRRLADLRADIEQHGGSVLPDQNR